MNRKIGGLILAGACAGSINGLFGAGGGMVLVPLLCLLTDLQDREIFSASIAVILPVSLISLTATAMCGPVPWGDSLPYLIGGALGGLAAGFFENRIPEIWLHRGLGVLIIWGGIRYLC